MKPDYRERINETKDLIGKYFFKDNNHFPVGGQDIEHSNLALAIGAYVSNSNLLLMGEHGSAKTTLTKTLGAILSGLPFDLYEAAQIQGHPDQTFETMFARPDFGKMNIGEEAVIFLLPNYLPLMNLDEINRLPEGKQDDVLDIFETGRVTYLGQTLYSGKKPLIATANHSDGGNHDLLPPLRDRFIWSLELGYWDSIERREVTEILPNIEELKCPEITGKAIRIVNNKHISDDDKFAAINALKKEYATHLNGYDIPNLALTKEDVAQIQKEIKSIPFTDAAMVFSLAIDSELNRRPNHGPVKRSDNPNTLSECNQAKKLISYNVLSSFSFRGAGKALTFGAQYLAYLAGHDKVTKDHIATISPYALSHRLDFTDDFKSKFPSANRYSEKFPNASSYDFFLSTRLIKEVEEKFPDLEQKMIDHFVYQRETKLPLSKRQLSPEKMSEIEEMVKDNAIIPEHPLIWEFRRRIRRQMQKEGKL
jgi:MoxR-like ATPase